MKGRLVDSPLIHFVAVEKLSSPILIVLVSPWKAPNIRLIYALKTTKSTIVETIVIETDVGCRTPGRRAQRPCTSPGQAPLGRRCSQRLRPCIWKLQEFFLEKKI